MNKNKRFHDVTLKLIKMLNAVLITVPFAVCWMGYYAERTYAPYYAKGNWAVIALFLVLYTVYGNVYDALLLQLSRISEMIYSQSLSALISDAIMYIVCWLLTKHLPAVWPLLFVFAAQFLLAAAWSYMANHWYFRSFPPKRTAVVYDMREGLEQLLEEYGLDRRFLVETTVNVKECLEKQMDALHGMEAVFLCGIHSRERNIVLKYCVANHITAYVIPRIGDILMSSARQMHMLHLPILQVKKYSPGFEYVVAKRFLDIVLSGVVLLILSPLMLIVAAAIKATDGGPVFYRQCRLTKDRKEFTVLKFRSMRVDAEGDGVARLSTGENDDRITPVGRVIRKTRIDELPQLLNIIAGDMSIVGPRPERPEIAEQYEKELPEFALRLQAKAGLTGYAQVYGKYNTTPYDKLQMDLMYIAKPSILEDFRIIFATVKILFTAESTEGVREGAATAMEVGKDQV
ncbi:MAG: exopolysaccharide biosynthesis polyprenyl glycosylphosphotransferase [Roseburia sp.]|nr:exopolysaccharide biosynthesis polyprenyl glycosylphosphotransferase [Roseburia sp.]